MKFFTTFAFGVLTMNAMAAPVITEGRNIFFDSEVSTKFYHVSDELNFRLTDEGKPFFVMYPHMEGGTTQLSALFDMKKSSYLDFMIDNFLDEGFTLARLPVKETYFRIDSDIKKYFQDNKTQTHIYRNGISIVTYLNEEGAKDMPELLKASPEKINIFTVCQEVEGVSPQLRGSFTYNLNTIHENFKNLSGTEVSYAEILNSVRSMADQKIIDVQHRGEGGKLDHIASMTRKLIPLMFKGDDRNDKFTLNTALTFADQVVTHKVNGRENIKKDFCLNANLGDLKNYPELIK